MASDDFCFYCILLHFYWLDYMFLDYSLILCFVHHPESSVAERIINKSIFLQEKKLMGRAEIQIQICNHCVQPKFILQLPKEPNLSLPSKFSWVPTYKRLTWCWFPNDLRMAKCPQSCTWYASFLPISVLCYNSHHTLVCYKSLIVPMVSGMAPINLVANCTFDCSFGILMDNKDRGWIRWRKC